MNVLVLNAGSSSLKASLFDIDAIGEDGAAPTGLRWEANLDATHDALGTLLAPLWTGPDAPLASVSDIDAIGHRVVHGGALAESVRLSTDVRAALRRADEDSASHNAPSIALMEEATALFGQRVPQCAVFDTTFHRTMPPAAYTYAGPHAWLALGIRRYGFHGLSHAYASARVARLLDRVPNDLRIITCHLGGGCSLAAVRDGRSVDTTMGFTPLDGVAMGTRSGAVDPGILLHLLRHGETPASLDRVLSHESGLAGLSGTSGDMRVVLAAMDAGEARAQLAFDVFVHRVQQGIGAMAASLGGVDALVFTGGVGEHAPRVREAICAPLGFLGVALDATRNTSLEGEGDVSADAVRVSTHVVPAQENWMVARECVRLVGEAAGGRKRMTGEWE